MCHLIPVPRTRGAAAKPDYTNKSWRNWPSFHRPHGLFTEWTHFIIMVIDFVISVWTAPPYSVYNGEISTSIKAECIKEQWFMRKDKWTGTATSLSLSIRNFIYQCKCINNCCCFTVLPSCFAETPHYSLDKPFIKLVQLVKPAFGQHTLAQGLAVYIKDWFHRGKVVACVQR